MADDSKSGGEEYVVGYRYYVGMHMVLCHGPADALINVKVNSKIVWEGEDDGVTSVNTNAPWLYGGEDAGGGVGGNIGLAMGHPTQEPDPYLQSILGWNIPAFRGVVSIILNHYYVGNAPHISPFSFRLKRTDTLGFNGVPQWYPEKATINYYHANPAHIIRECLTDATWGMGYGTLEMDDVSFRYAAATLYDEGLGLSFLWTHQTPIEDFIIEVLRHIDGALYIDRVTGRFMIKLVRNDYVKAELPLLDQTNLYHVKNLVRATMGELVNTVTVKYTAFETGEAAAYTIHDPALRIQQGVTIGITNTYEGITTPELAASTAARDLTVVSTQIMSCSVECNRAGAEGLNVGDVLRLTWEPYRLEEEVMRVVSMHFGSTHNGQITIQLVQDIFAKTEPLYALPPGSGWVPPDKTPLPVEFQYAQTLSYYRLANRIGDEAAQALDPTDAFLGVVAEKPQSLAYSASLWVAYASGGPYTDYGQIDWCPAGTVALELGYLDDTLTLTGDTRRLGVGTYIQLGRDEADFEITEITEVSDTTLKLTRGCLDTIPHKHSIGDEWYAVGSFGCTDGQDHSVGETLYVKLTTYTGEEELDLADAPYFSTTLTNRQYRPYPPAKLTFNTEYFPEFTTGQEITIAWVHRDRLQQTTELIDFTEASIGPEAGTTYNFTLYNDTRSTTIFSGSLTDLSKVFTNVDFADWADLDSLTLTLESERDGVTSMQQYSHTFLAHPNSPAFLGTISDILAYTGTPLWPVDVSSYFDSDGLPSSYSMTGEPSWIYIDDSGLITSDAPTVIETITGVSVTATNITGSVTSNTFSIIVALGVPVFTGTIPNMISGI